MAWAYPCPLVGFLELNSPYYPETDRARCNLLSLPLLGCKGLCLRKFANTEVLKWLSDVPNCRDHSTLKLKPVDLWAEEIPVLQRLPIRLVVATPKPTPAAVANHWPTEQLQRSPSEYDRLLQGGER